MTHMSNNPINGETGAALALFFYGGDGPSHGELSRAFAAAGLASFDDYKYEPGVQGPNKQQRVLTICRVAEKRSESGKKLAEGLLNALRLKGAFKDEDNAESIAALRSALLHVGWSLSEEGRLESLGSIQLETGGRAALDEQLARLRRNLDDPAMLLGVAKELIESAAKYVMEEAGRPAHPKLPLPGLIDQSFELLGFVKPVAQSALPGAEYVADIYKGVRKIIVAVNELRNVAGTGHGRTLPTGVSDDMARFVVREAALVAELMLATHDRLMGRA